jgi:hypothetical protein
VNEKMADLLHRRPRLVAVVSALLGLVVVDGSRRAGATSNLSARWPVYAAVGMTAYVTVGFFASFKFPKLAGPTPESVRWACAVSPVVLCGVWVPLTNGPSRLAWVGLGLSWLLLALLVLTIRHAVRSGTKGQALPPRSV